MRGLFMKNFQIVCGLAMLALCASAASAADPAAADPATGDAAKKAASSWLEGLGKDGLVIVETDKENAFKGRMVGGTGSSMNVFSKPGWYINLGFQGKITADMTAADLQKKFKYVALDKLPTPGLDVTGWNIKPQTPVSSFSKGVEFLSYKDGVVKLRIKTNFFALYGRNPNVLVPADAPSPAGSYFQIRKNFPLDLTLEARLGMK